MQVTPRLSFEYGKQTARRLPWSHPTGSVDCWFALDLGTRACLRVRLRHVGFLFWGGTDTTTGTTAPMMWWKCHPWSMIFIFNLGSQKVRASGGLYAISLDIKPPRAASNDIVGTLWKTSATGETSNDDAYELLYIGNVQNLGGFGVAVYQIHQNQHSEFQQFGT